MKTWKCPKCGHSVEISQDALDGHGNAVGMRGHAALELPPAAQVDTSGRDAAVDRLVSKAQAADLSPEDMDETVHELAASIAADINNGGLDSQIGYLVEQMGTRGAQQQLDRLIKEKTASADDDA